MSLPGVGVLLLQGLELHSGGLAGSFLGSAHDLVDEVGDGLLDRSHCELEYVGELRERFIEELKVVREIGTKGEDGRRKGSVARTKKSK